MLLGRYEVIRSLGEGGTAKVLLAHSVASGQPVVLKVPILPDGDQLERVRDEARVGLRLQHPNIVETLDLFEHEGKPILVVEYVEGASLHQMRKVGPLAPAATVRVGRQIASALEAIHSATDEHHQPLNMLHRDVTPANILVARSGEAKLIDLGIARSAETQARATQAGAVRGTLRYLAPELIEGKKHSPSTDLWALGVVLWEAVLGRRAIVGDDREILTAILRGDVMKYQPGEALDPRLHDALSALIAPEAGRIQRAMAASNIFGRLEAAFGDGLPALQNAVDMAMRLAPDEAPPGMGERTEQLLSQQPRPVTIPPGAPPADAPQGRHVAALDDSMEDGAPTVQMTAADFPHPRSDSGPSAPQSRPAAAPTVDVAPVSHEDLRDQITGRYAPTEQAMPAVSAPAPFTARGDAKVAPLQQGTSTEAGLPAVGAGHREAIASQVPDVGSVAQGPTNVRGLAATEETENAFPNPYDETVLKSPAAGPPAATSPSAASPLAAPPVAAPPVAAPPVAAPPVAAPPAAAPPAAAPPAAARPAGQRADSVKSTMIMHGGGLAGLGLPADDVKSTQLVHGGLGGRGATGSPPPAVTEQALPAVDRTALDPALAATEVGPPPPTAPPPSAPPPTAPPAARPPAPSPAATAPAQPALDITAEAPQGPSSLAGPPVAEAIPDYGQPTAQAPYNAPGGRLPTGATPPPPAAAPPAAAPPAAAPPAAAPPAAAPPAAAPPAAAPPAAAPSAAAPPVAAPPVAAPPAAAPPAAAPPAAAPPAAAPPPAAAAPPASAPPPAAAKPAAPALGTPPPAGPDQPFGMTVTQAFFTKDIKAAMMAEAAETEPHTVEMEAAIAPVEGKIALLIAGIAVVVIVVIAGLYFAFSGGEDTDAPPPPAAVDAGPPADAGPAAAAQKAKDDEEKDKGKKGKKPKKRRSKRRK